MTNLSPQTTQRDSKAQTGSTRARGSRSLAFVLDQCEYPCAKADLMENVGDQDVEFVDGGSTTVGEILERLPETKFSDSSIVKLAIFTHWDSIGKELGSGRRANRRRGGTRSRRAHARSAARGRSQKRTPARVT